MPASNISISNIVRVRPRLATIEASRGILAPKIMPLMTKIKCKELATKNKVSDIGNFDHYFFREDLDGKQYDASGVQNMVDNGNTKGQPPQELAQNLQNNPALAANEICLLNSVNQIEILPQYQVLMDKLKEEVI